MKRLGNVPSASIARMVRSVRPVIASSSSFLTTRSPCIGASKRIGLFFPILAGIGMQGECKVILLSVVCA